MADTWRRKSFACARAAAGIGRRKQAGRITWKEAKSWTSCWRRNVGLSKMFNNMLWTCGRGRLDSNHTIRTNILDSWAVRMCMHSSSALNFVVVMQVDRPGFEGRSSSHPADVSIALKLEALGSCRVVGVILVILLVAELCETFFLYRRHQCSCWQLCHAGLMNFNMFYRHPFIRLALPSNFNTQKRTCLDKQSFFFAIAERCSLISFAMVPCS